MERGIAMRPRERRETSEQDLFRSRLRPAAVADAADGGASDPQAHLRSFRRGFMRSLGGEPVLQYFCGEEFFQHALVFDRSSLTRWRQRMGEEKLQALLQGELGGGHPEGRDEAARSR